MNAAGSDASNAKAIEDLQEAVTQMQVMLEDLTRDMDRERPMQKQPYRNPKIGIRQERQSTPKIPQGRVALRRSAMAVGLETT